MSFDFNTLITDRTKADVSYLFDLMKKPLDQWSSEELEQFNSGRMKGGYSWADINRVIECLEYLSAELELLGRISNYSPIKIHRPGVPGVSKLPEGYTELEYIESTGTQYIDTGIKPNWATRVVCDARFSVQTTGAWLFGARDGNAINSYGFLTYKGKYRSDFGSNVSPLLSEIYGPDIHVDKNGKDTYVNGNLLHSGDSQEFYSSYNLCIGANMSAGAVSGFGKARHKSYRIYEEDVKVREYIPCKDTEGSVGMYDLVTESFFYNAGSGFFVAGPEAEEEIVENPLNPLRFYKTDNINFSIFSMYLNSVKKMTESIDFSDTLSSLVPNKNNGFSIKDANSIEKILIFLNEIIKTTKLGFIPCGDSTCGGENF